MNALRRLVLGAWLALACTLHAAPVKLDSLQVGSRTYHHVTVLGANDSDLFFTHDQGIANVKLRLLAPELQERFNYDPKSAAEAEQSQSEGDALYQAALASNLLAQAGQAAISARRAAATSEESLADPISDSSLIGKQAPALEVEKWLGEKPALEGKFVLVCFWAPWSIPSRRWIPELNSLQKKFAEKLVVAGVASAPEDELLKMNDPKLEFASAIDSKSKLSVAAGVTSVPSVLLLDPKGLVLYAGHPGAITEKKLRGILAKAAE